MERKTDRKQVNAINFITDAIILFLCYICAMYLRFSVFGGTVTINPLSPKLLVAIAVLSMAVALSYQAYRSNYIVIPIANAVGTVLIMAVFFIYRITEFSRLSLLIYWVVATVLVILKHMIGHKILSSFYGHRRKLIVGTGATAKSYLSECGEDLPLISCDDLAKALEENETDELIIALEVEEAPKIPSVLQLAYKDGLYVSMVPFYSEYIPPNPEIESLGKTKVINLRATPLDNPANAAIKRIIDIVGSFLLLIITSPLMLIAAIGVKLSSPGPIFFKQERVGKDKINFKMLKFRSMRVNAEENTAWSKDVDPRRTKFGSFIRKYSIDELPQFINVLKGDMSLVGPRPEIPYYVHQFRETIPLYLVRQQVRPGITGWSQIHGLRGNTSIEDRVEYDIWYIENWSLWLDIKILFLTVFGGKFKNNEQ